jgi:hypothetical protein
VSILIFCNKSKRELAHSASAVVQEGRTVEQTKATDERLGTQEREELLRDYASGTISWRELRQRGFADYVEVLAGLGEIGLRPPMAPMEGPSRNARERGRALLRRLLREAAKS